MLNNVPPPRKSDGQNCRLREFDALRGFSMLSVVFAHTLSQTGVDAGATVSGAFVISYFMPLFFFISGYFAFKPYEKWTKETYRRQIPQKIKALVICTLVFYTFRYYYIGANPLGWIEHGFMGYWFTIVLFDMFVIYYAVTAIARLINKDCILPLMIVLGLSGPILIQLGMTDEGWFGTIFGTTNLCFFLQWFVLGLVAKRYFRVFRRILLDDRVKAILIIAYIIGLCGFHDNIPSPVVAKIAGSVVVPYIGVLTLVALFYSFSDYFNSNAMPARFLCFSGRRTLDIYMLHYFFLPSLPMLGVWIAPDSMLLFQMLVGGVLAIAITAVCLLLSNCLRTSTLLADWLFGVRVAQQ